MLEKDAILIIVIFTPCFDGFYKTAEKNLRMHRQLNLLFFLLFCSANSSTAKL